MEFLNTIKEQIPDYAKDIRLNIDGVIGRSSLAPEAALGVALSRVSLCAVAGVQQAVVTGDLSGLRRLALAASSERSFAPAQSSCDHASASAAIASISRATPASHSGSTSDSSRQDSAASLASWATTAPCRPSRVFPPTSRSASGTRPPTRW